METDGHRRVVYVRFIAERYNKPMMIWTEWCGTVILLVVIQAVLIIHASIATLCSKLDNSTSLTE